MIAATERDVSSAFDPAEREHHQLALAHVTAESLAGRPVHAKEVALRIGVTPTRAWKLLRDLAREGSVLPLVGRDGWVASGDASRSVGAPPVTLDDLVSLARDKVDPAWTPRRGRQALHLSRDIHAITPGQLADIERLAVLIARYGGGSNGRHGAANAALMSWDDTANNGRGGWALVEHVRRWAELEHRTKHDAKQLRSPAGAVQVWTPALAAKTVGDYQGAANNLLYLAATHGVISQSQITVAGMGTLYAPGWAPTIERWARWIGRRGGSANPQRVVTGCRTLAIYATAAGGMSVRDTDWLAVRRALESDLPLKGKARRVEAARYVWKLAVGEFGPRFNLGAEFAWPLEGEDPISLVATRAARAPAVADLAPSERDFSGWVLRDGSYAAGLVEGQYGLRRWAAWSTLDDILLEHEQPPLPRREWALESSIVSRRRIKRPRRVVNETLQTRLRYFNWIAGYAAREHGIDWRSADGLVTLCNPELVEALLVWTIRERSRDPRGNGKSQLAHIVRTCAWVVNGFLIGQAKLSGDLELVARLEGWYRRLEQIGQKIPTPNHKDLAKVVANVLATASAWKGTDGVDGLKKLTGLAEALEHELVDLAQGRPVEQQIADLRIGAWRAGPQWGKTLRLIVVLLVGQRVPLRGRTMSGLEMRHWKAIPVGEAQRKAEAMGLHQPWEGALALEIDAELMKSKREFNPALILPENVATVEQAGSAAHERAIRRDLLELWFCENGGRDVCRTVVDPVTQRATRLDVPWVFPDALGDSYGGSGQSPEVRKSPKRNKRTRISNRPGMWTRGRLSAAFRRAVMRHGADLGIDLRALRRTRGGFGFHVLRRLFGSYWAVRNILVASKLLDHASLQFTADVYCAQDVRTMSLDVAASP